MIETPEKLKPYQFHGVDFSAKQKQTQADCPFCGKTGGMGILTATGIYHCVACDESGNIPKFLQTLHAHSLEQTTSDDYQRLAEERGVHPHSIKEWGLARNLITGDWIVPAYNKKNALANLSKIISIDGKQRVCSAPGCLQHPFGTQTLRKEQKTRWIAEGLWDGIALHTLLRSIKSANRKGKRTYVRTTDETETLIQSIGVFAVPGVASFKPEWGKLIEGTEAFIAYDNDYPKRQCKHCKKRYPTWAKRCPHCKGSGQIGKVLTAGCDGVNKAVEVLSNGSPKPNTLNRIAWGEKGYSREYPDGFDVGDLFKEAGPVKTYRTLLSLSEPLKLKKAKPKNEVEEVEVIEPLPRSTFRELCKDWESTIHFPKTLRDSLIISLACTISTEIPGEQIWIRLIGPPGSGKSTIAEALSACPELTFPVSIQTGFHSGLGDGASLVPQMDGKTVIIKDADTLLNSNGRDRILAELRDIYDGTTRARYRNKQTHIYENLRITFLLCGTDTLRKLNRSSLGERFLDCEILADEDRTPYLKRSIANSYAIISRGMNPDSDKEAIDTTLLKRATIGYLHHIKEQIPNLKPPELTQTSELAIESMGQFLAYMRAGVEREKEDILLRPRVELATRLCSQFVKLAVSLSIALQKTKIDKEVIRLLRKVVADSSEGFQFELTRLLAKQPRGMNAKQLEISLGIGEGTVRRLISDMRELNIIERNHSPNRSGQRGRNLHIWQLTDELKTLYKTAIGGLK